MKKAITVKKFCENFLDPNQRIRVTDIDSDYLYTACYVRDILESNEILYSARLQKVTNYHSPTYPDGIELFI